MLILGLHEIIASDEIKDFDEIHSLHLQLNKLGLIIRVVVITSTGKEVPLKRVMKNKERAKLVYERNKKSTISSPYDIYLQSHPQFWL